MKVLYLSKLTNMRILFILTLLASFLFSCDDHSAKQDPTPIDSSDETEPLAMFPLDTISKGEAEEFMRNYNSMTSIPKSMALRMVSLDRDVIGRISNSRHKRLRMYVGANAAMDTIVMILQEKKRSEFKYYRIPNSSREIQQSGRTSMEVSDFCPPPELNCGTIEEN